MDLQVMLRYLGAQLLVGQIRHPLTCPGRIESTIRTTYYVTCYRRFVGSHCAGLKDSHSTDVLSRQSTPNVSPPRAKETIQAGLGSSINVHYVGLRRAHYRKAFLEVFAAGTTRTINSLKLDKADTFLREWHVG